MPSAVRGGQERSDTDPRRSGLSRMRTRTRVQLRKLRKPRKQVVAGTRLDGPGLALPDRLHHTVRIIPENNAGTQRMEKPSQPLFRTANPLLLNGRAVADQYTSVKISSAVHAFPGRLRRLLTRCS